MKKRIMSLLISVIMVASVLAGCGSEAGGSARKGDTMTVSEMFDALVEDNGGEGVYYTSSGKKISSELNVVPFIYDGETIVWGYTTKDAYTNCSEKVELGKIASGEVSIMRANEYGDSGVYDPFDFNLVTNEEGDIVSETICTIENKNDTIIIDNVTMEFNGTNVQRVQIENQTFVCFTFVDGNNTKQLIIPETESMVGKTIVMDSVGTEGVYVNLED